MADLTPQEHIEGLRRHYTRIQRDLETSGAVYAVQGQVAGQEHDRRRYRHAESVLDLVERLSKEVERG